MLQSIISKIIGSKNQRLLKPLYKTVNAINSLEESYKQLSDSEIKDKKEFFQQELQQGKTLDDLLPAAFALVREASVRNLGLRHFDVQLLGGICLHKGMVSQMRTGEGKTLVATLAAYLNALSGNSVHIVTVNDYLAERDADWMTPLYQALGMSVGKILSTQEHHQKHQNYQADIVYGTNNEFGFDYLRDNMAVRKQDIVQGKLEFAIIDEVDSILIDEARTPLIISGAAENVSRLYKHINSLMPKIFADDTNNSFLKLDLENHSLELTDEGHEYIENLLIENKIMEPHANLYDAKNLSLLHYVTSSLRAHKLFKRNVHYLVKNKQIVIIDEHTGRALPGRRWSNGLHQAVEAKENLTIQNENQTLASTSFQNYFLLYTKLSGMTGTADTEAAEFKEIYKLDVAVIPTNKTSQREDLNDLIYATADEKYTALIKEVKQELDKKRPILIGTGSVIASEYISNLLIKHKIKHNVLNAKHHDKEAQIIAEAGVPGAVTVATNMAGRGTDIVLGGNLQLEIAQAGTTAKEDIEKLTQRWQERNQIAKDAGGLYVICSERHESRRIDNQLRGRCGRQGDPGATRFFLSLEDDLMKIFVSDQVKKIMNFIGLEKDVAIEHPMVNRAIAKAQHKVEQRNFQARKQLLEYDDIANEQRNVVYSNRKELLHSDNISEYLNKSVVEAADTLCQQYIPANADAATWQIEKLEQLINITFKHDIKLQEFVDQSIEQAQQLDTDQLYSYVTKTITNLYTEKVHTLEPNIMLDLQRQIVIQVIDHLWKTQLQNMDQLRQGIHFRSYAQKNPKQEYKRESFEMFKHMWHSIGLEFCKAFFNIDFARIGEDIIKRRQEARQEAATKEATANLHNTANSSEEQSISKIPTPNKIQAPNKKIGRNDPCFCGSGKKFKHCCGK